MKKIYDYIITFAILILSNDTLFGGVLLGIEKSTVILVVLSIPMYIIFLKNRRINKDIIVVWVLIFLILLTIVFNNEFRGFHTYMIFSIITAYIYCKVYSFTQMKENYLKVMTFLCLYSLITTYFIKYLGLGIPKVTNTANVTLYNFVFSYAIPTSNYIRNFGIFREPGVYQIFISLAMIFEIFNNKNINKKKLILFTVTMFSTFSTVGFVNLFIIYAIYFIINIKNIKMNKKWIYNVMSLGIVSIIAITMLMKNKVIQSNIETAFAKIENTESFTVNNARWESITYLLPKVFDKPWCGNGCSFFIQELKINTNTIISIFVIYGLPFGIIYILLIYNFCTKVTQNTITQIGIFLILFFSLCCQYMPYNIFLWVIYLILFMKKQGEGLENNENSLDS